LRLKASQKNGLVSTVSARALNVAIFTSLSDLFHHRPPVSQAARAGTTGYCTRYRAVRVTDGKPNSELGASDGPKESMKERRIAFAAEPAMKSAIAILILVGSIDVAFSEETCTPQSVQFCTQQSVSCFNASQCRGNPKNCQLRCCVVYTSCLSSRSCDAGAYRCSN
jgi:hypothetical protein